MKFPTRAIVTSILATIFVAGHAVADSHTSPSPTWKGHHSTISKYPPKYGDQKYYVSKTNTTIDASRNADGSFNSDRSFKADGSFNSDRSFKAVGSFNPNTDIDIATASQNVRTRKDLVTGDNLGSSSSANLFGAQQSASQGDVLASIGNGGGVSNGGGGFLNRSVDNPTIITDQTLRADGDNFGNMSNLSMVNYKGEQAGRNNRSAEGTRIGNDQFVSSGDQSTFQQPNVVKNGDTTAIASDDTTSSAGQGGL